MWASWLFANFDQCGGTKTAPAKSWSPGFSRFEIWPALPLPHFLVVRFLPPSAFDEKVADFFTAANREMRDMPFRKSLIHMGFRRKRRPLRWGSRVEKVGDFFNTTLSRTATGEARRREYIPKVL